jgi:monothiol glutaredoxin
MVELGEKSNPIFDEIQKDITAHEVIIYMKGTPEAPMCGFSAYVVQLFKKYKVEFKSVNVLANENLRQAIKDFTNWPTIPQIYIKGEFIGGCDILRTLNESGELIELFKKYNIAFQKPEISGA